MSNHEEVLVIDDEAGIRDLVKTIVEAEGYLCTAFADARQALQRVQEGAVIAIFVDIRMPGMDGLQFLHELRKSHPAVPVVVMTGYADQDVFRQTIAFRIGDFLAKPFDADLVRAALRKVLGRDDAYAEAFLETITFRLRRARLALGLKQGEVAQRCGLSTSLVSQIESRQSSPSILTLLKLCKALNLSMTALVEGF